jgi:hypothetical protein
MTRPPASALVTPDAVRRELPATTRELCERLGVAAGSTWRVRAVLRKLEHDGDVVRDAPVPSPRWSVQPRRDALRRASSAATGGPQDDTRGREQAA